MVNAAFFCFLHNKIIYILKKFTLHDLRRTLFGDILDLDIDIVTVADLVGNDDPRTTKRYGRRSKQIIKDSLEKLTRKRSEKCLLLQLIRKETE